MTAQAGKGDTPRKVDGEAYRSNYDNIFRYMCLESLAIDMMKVQDSMKALAHQMQEYENEELKRHGREMNSAAGIIGDWIDEIEGLAKA